MDKLKEALREDAAAIDATVSVELDHRIRASLEGIQPERPEKAPRPRRGISMWWASSLTGIAAAAAVIVAINLSRDEVPEAAPTNTVAGAQNVPPVMPELTARAAVLAGPLEEELEALESDLRKAEQAVREEMGLGL